MRLTIFTDDDGTVEVADFDRVSALDLVQEMNHPQASEFLVFELDSSSTVVIGRRHIVRIDIDED